MGIRQLGTGFGKIRIKSGCRAGFGLGQGSSQVVCFGRLVAVFDRFGARFGQMLGGFQKFGSGLGHSWAAFDHWGDIQHRARGGAYARRGASLARRAAHPQRKPWSTAPPATRRRPPSGLKPNRSPMPRARRQRCPSRNCATPPADFGRQARLTTFGARLPTP